MALTEDVLGRENQEGKTKEKPFSCLGNLCFVQLLTTSKTMSGFEYEIFGAKGEVTCMADVRAAPSHSSSQGVAEESYVFLGHIIIKILKILRTVNSKTVKQL